MLCVLINRFQNMIRKLFSIVYVYVSFLLRYILKYFFRKTTRLCELQRICYSTDKGYKRCSQIENSIKFSKNKVIKKIDKKLSDLADSGKFNIQNKYEVAQTIEFAVEAICKAKNIKTSYHEDFLIAIRTSLLQIYGYKQLFYEINCLKNTAYNDEDNNHETKLIEIWKYLKPFEKLSSRITKQWTDIGFQGTDPKTDFRGMGILGLLNLNYFIKNYTSTAQNILLHSSHPVHGYPFAITGINITHMAYLLLKNNNFKTHFFNSYFGTIRVEDFHKVYCYLFVKFDQLWIKEKPKDVMEFCHIKEKFLKQLSNKLDLNDCTLKWEPSIDLI